MMFRKALGSAAMLVSAVAITALLTGAAAPQPAPPASSEPVSLSSSEPVPYKASRPVTLAELNSDIGPDAWVTMYSAPVVGTYVVGNLAPGDAIIIFECSGNWMHIRTLTGRGGDHHQHTVAWVLIRCP